MAFNIGSFVRGSFKPTGLDIGKGRRNVSSIKWEGLDKVVDNLNKEVAKIKRVSVKNLLTAGLLVKGKAQKIVPVDTANLKASAYVISGGGKNPVKIASPEGKEGTFGGKDKNKMTSRHNSIIASRKERIIDEPFAIIGFTAFYALFVHEDLTASHVKKATVQLFGEQGKANVQIGQAKFLEQALLENRAQILSILKRRIQK